MSPSSRDLDWRTLYPGAEAAITAAGIDPDRVYRVTGVDEFRYVGDSQWQGPVEARFRELHVEHIAVTNLVEGQGRPMIPPPPRVLKAVLPWPGDSEE